MDWSQVEDMVSYSRKQLRGMGLLITDQTFRRWEKKGLKCVSAPGPSSRKEYLGRELKRFKKVT